MLQLKGPIDLQSSIQLIRNKFLEFSLVSTDFESNHVPSGVLILDAHSTYLGQDQHRCSFVKL